MLRKDVHCRNLRWTVTDTCSSPDGIWLAYATINPTVHLARAPHPTLPYPRSPPSPAVAWCVLRPPTPLYPAHGDLYHSI